VKDEGGAVHTPWWQEQRAQLVREFNDELRLGLLQLDNLYAAHEAVHHAVDLAGMQAVLMSLGMVASELAESSERMANDAKRAAQYREIAQYVEQALETARCLG
jgi:hypothetical protein